MTHWLFLPNDAAKEIGTLARLESDKLAELRRLLDSRDARPSSTFYVKVADSLGLSDEDAGNLCTFINYVQKQRIRHKKSGDNIPEEIERFLTKNGQAELSAKIQERKKAIATLFRDFPVQDFSTKTRGLENGPLPHLHQFRTFCDVRPVFNDDGSKIVSCFPIVTCWFVVHESESNETNEFRFQITEEDVEELTSQFGRLEKKLAEIRDRFSSFLAKKDEE